VGPLAGSEGLQLRGDIDVVLAGEIGHVLGFGDPRRAVAGDAGFRCIRRVGAGRQRPDGGMRRIPGRKFGKGVAVEARGHDTHHMTPPGNPRFSGRPGKYSAHRTANTSAEDNVMVSSAAS
jgi:hypothetical protein